MAEYVEERSGGLYITGTRVSLDSVVYAWRSSRKPEEIQRSFPSLSLAAIYGAVAYYLDHQAEVDAYLYEGKVAYERARAAQRAADPEFYARMRQKMSDARERFTYLPL